jgi:hypothetical protein
VATWTKGQKYLKTLAQVKKPYSQTSIHSSTNLFAYIRTMKPSSALVLLAAAVGLALAGPMVNTDNVGIVSQQRTCRLLGVTANSKVQQQHEQDCDLCLCPGKDRRCSCYTRMDNGMLMVDKVDQCYNTLQRYKSKAFVRACNCKKMMLPLGPP